MKQNCLFAKTKFQILLFYFLKDTGSVVSIISKLTFEKLKIPSSALDGVQTTLTSAEGSELKVYGKISLKFSMSNKVFEQEFLVADLHLTYGILGMDFLEKFEASLIVGKANMTIAGHQIRLYRMGHNSCSNIKFADKTVIPPESEIIIDSYLFGKPLQGTSILEPRKDLIKQGIMVSRTICDKSNEKLWVNLINLSKHAVTLSQDTLLGRLDPIESAKLYCVKNNLEFPENENQDDNTKCPRTFKVFD